MLGEVLDAVTVVEGGVAGDRAYALVDDATGKVISVKRPKRWGRLFEMSALTGPDGVVVHLPDGEALSIDDSTLAGRLSDLLGRSVSIATVPPAGAVFDEVWLRDLKAGADPYL